MPSPCGNMLPSTPRFAPPASAAWPGPAAALSDRLDAPGGGAIAGRPALDALRRTIATFTTARYSRDGRLPDGELSRALEDGISLLNDLRWRSAAPVRHAARLGTALTHWRRRWAR